MSGAREAVAAAVLAELQAKMESERARERLLTDARKAVAYEAHVQGGAAKKKLEGLIAEAATLAREIDALEGAVAEAQRRVDEARMADEADAEAERLRLIATFGPKLRARGAAMSEAMKVLRREIEAAMVDVTELQRLGHRGPTLEMVRIHATIALKSELFLTPLRVEHLAPRDRLSFVDLFGRWADNLDGAAPPIQVAA